MLCWQLCLFHAQCQRDVSDLEHNMAFNDDDVYGMASLGWALAGVVLVCAVLFRVPKIWGAIWQCCTKSDDSDGSKGVRPTLSGVRETYGIDLHDCDTADIAGRPGYDASCPLGQGVARQPCCFNVLGTLRAPRGVAGMVGGPTSGELAQATAVPNTTRVHTRADAQSGGTAAGLAFVDVAEAVVALSRTTSAPPTSATVRQERDIMPASEARHTPITTPISADGDQLHVGYEREAVQPLVSPPVSGLNI